MANRILLNTRVSPELRRELKILAAQQNRTLGNLIETLLQQGIARAAAESEGARPPVEKG